MLEGPIDRAESFVFRSYNMYGLLINNQNVSIGFVLIIRICE